MDFSRPLDIALYPFCKLVPIQRACYFLPQCHTICARGDQCQDFTTVWHQDQIRKRNVDVKQFVAEHCFAFTIIRYTSQGTVYMQKKPHGGEANIVFVVSQREQRTS